MMGSVREKRWSRGCPLRDPAGSRHVPCPKAVFPPLSQRKVTREGGWAPKVDNTEIPARGRGVQERPPMLIQKGTL